MGMCVEAGKRFGRPWRSHYGIVVLVLLASHCSLAADTTTTSVPAITVKDVAIYYDTTPASLNFLLKQLAPMLQNAASSVTDDASQRIHLRLIPYGPSKHRYDHATKSYQFECAESSCDVLMKSACLLHAAPSTNDTVAANYDLVQQAICVLNATVADNLICNGMERLQDNCDAVLANYGLQTESVRPRIAHFPAVVIDDEYKPEVSEKLVANLKMGLEGQTERMRASNRCNVAMETATLLQLLAFQVFTSLLYTYMTNI